MKLAQSSDTTAHVTEMETHFHLMQERVDELATIGDPIGARISVATVQFGTSSNQNQTTKVTEPD